MALKNENNNNALLKINFNLFLVPIWKWIKLKNILVFAIATLQNELSTIFFINCSVLSLNNVQDKS
jgi:hypothetical protein